MNNANLRSTLGWVIVALVLPGIVFLATAAVMSIPPNTRGIDTVAGRDLFRAHCGACHFAEAGFPAHHGPNLHDIGRTAATRKPKQSAAAYILESILDPSEFIAPSSRAGMPNNVAVQLAPADIRNIVGFLAGRKAFPDYDEIMRLEIPDRRTHQQQIAVSLTKMKLAEQVIRDKGSCLRCHSLYSIPESKILAPGLFGVGLVDRELVKQSIVHPDKVVSPAFRNVTVVLDSGKLVSGRLMTRTNDRLILFTRDEQNQLARQEIRLSDVEQEEGQPLILESQNSLMPTGYDKLLTEQELEAVITLIQQLN